MATTTRPRLTPENIGVQTVPTRELEPNPHNPRTLFDREPLEILKSSIEKVGILVPLTVYRAKGRSKYTILDGQRRWMCAIDLNLPSVPVNQVREPNIVQNIVTMFQIHKLREDWELMPTALKLGVLMEKMRERNERKLAELTGLDRAVVARCKKLLSYPKEFQDMMLDPDPAKRQKADFFIELYPILHDRDVARFDWFHKDNFTRRMLKKYSSPSSDLKAVTDFRMIKQHINNARRGRKLVQMSRRLREYASDDELPMQHLSIESAEVTAATNRLLKDIERLNGELAGIDVEKYYGEEKLWQALARLLHVIRKKLVEADRRVTV
jgi:ParB/RepB/Spo0J family partition protein